jgi:hypothetical protein
LKLRFIIFSGLTALLVRPPVPAFAQNAAADTPPLEQRPGVVIREIDDSATGDRWLLVRDAVNPGGPGRMVRVEPGKADLANGTERDPARKGAQTSAATPLRPAIHAGDAVIVEEHTSVVDARLEAVALGSAAVGAEFKARLKIGGKVVRVVAKAAGRAEMPPATEAQP